MSESQQKTGLPEVQQFLSGGNSLNLPTPDRARTLIIQALATEYNNAGTWATTSDPIGGSDSGASETHYDADASHGVRVEFTITGTQNRSYNSSSIAWSGRRTLFKSRAAFAFQNDQNSQGFFFHGLGNLVDLRSPGFNFCGFCVRRPNGGVPLTETWLLEIWQNNVVLLSIDTHIPVGTAAPGTGNLTYHDFKISITNNLATFYLDGKAVGAINLPANSFPASALGSFVQHFSQSGSNPTSRYGVEFMYLENATI